MVDEDAVLARLSGAKKRYGETVALDGLDLDVRQGELLAVLGPNGVGKSTAIALLLGLQRPDAGAAAFANILYLSMAFLSGLFFPLPPALQPFKTIWPTYHLKELALASASLPSEGSVVTHVAVLALITVVLTSLAARKLARVG